MFNLSKSDFKSPLGKLLRFPLKLISGNTALPIIQGPLKGKRWVKGSATNGCWLGTYELDKQVAFSKYIKPGITVYDVGANVGFYTLLASVRTNANGKVFSFEPLPENISYLKKHIELNGLRNVEVIEKAVSDKVTKLRFTTSSDRSMNHISSKGEIVVQSINLDEFIKQGNPLPDIIKMDIEGAELDALVGAKEILKTKKPVIFLATHSNELRDKCLKLLAEMGYSVETIDKKPLAESDDFVCV